MEDIYKTIITPSEETLFKEKGSKFFGYAYPVLSEEDVKERYRRASKKAPFSASFLLCLSVRNREN